MAFGRVCGKARDKICDPMHEPQAADSPIGLNDSERIRFEST
jgi:hypothetical protein